jgi:hypothetical protein
MKQWKQRVPLHILILVIEIILSLAVIVVIPFTHGFQSHLSFSSYYALQNLLTGKQNYLFGDPYILPDLFDLGASFFVILALVAVYLIIRKYLTWKKLQNFYSSHKEKILVTLLLIISLVTRISFINEGIFHHDSIGLAMVVHQVEQDGQIRPVISGRYGFVLANMAYYYGIKNFTAITNYDYTLNFITALFGSLAVLFAYLIARKYLSTEAAFSASLLFIFMPIVWSVSTFAKEHGVSLFFTLFALYAFLYGIQKKSHCLLVLGGIALGMSMLVRITNALILLPLIFYILFEKLITKENGEKSSSRWTLYLAYFIPILLIILELLAFQWTDIRYESKYNQIAWQYPTQIAHNLYFSFLYNYRNLTFLGFAFLLVGFLMLILKKRMHAAFFALWILPTYLYIGATPYPSPRHFEVLLMPSAIVIMFGVQWIKECSHFQAKLVYGIILLGMILAVFPIIWSRHEYSGPKQYALYLNRISQPNSVFLSLDDHVFLEYYTDKSTIGIPYTESSEKVAQSMRDLRTLIGKGTHVYTSEKILYWLGKDIIYRNLAANFQLVQHGSVVSEDYHNAEIVLIIHQDRVYEILNKEDAGDKVEVYAYK